MVTLSNQTAQWQNSCANALISAISCPATSIIMSKFCKTFGTVIAWEGNSHPSVIRKVVPVLRFMYAF